MRHCSMKIAQKCHNLWKERGSVLIVINNVGKTKGNNTKIEQKKDSVQKPTWINEPSLYATCQSNLQQLCHSPTAASGAVLADTS